MPILRYVGLTNLSVPCVQRQHATAAALTLWCHAQDREHRPGTTARSLDMSAVEIEVRGMSLRHMLDLRLGKSGIVEALHDSASGSKWSTLLTKYAASSGSITYRLIEHSQHHQRVIPDLVLLALSTVSVA